VKKTRVIILFGGRSAEHEISILSARNVLAALDRQRFEPVLIGIDRAGRWHQESERTLAGATGDPRALALDPAAPAVGIEEGLVPRGADPADDVVVFPVLHGTFGEDGTIQGLLELADIPYVGAGVLGSAAGMDKDIMKSLFRAAALPMVKHVTFLRSEWEASKKKVQKLVESKLKYPVFVKPANLGSSVGITKAHDRKELPECIEEAAKFDRKIIVEEAVGGKKNKAREIECSVLGNDQPKASVPGEIVPIKEFYDYAAKYLDEGSELVIPTKLTKTETKRVQQLAIAAFQAVDCSGLARVDFLMDPKTRKIYLNEINTMPGFTAISMYPKLWAASGLSYPDLIDRLIQLGLERHAEKMKNQYSR